MAVVVAANVSRTQRVACVVGAAATTALPLGLAAYQGVWSSGVKQVCEGTQESIRTQREGF